MAEYISPNDTKNEKGEIVPESAEAIAKRLRKLRGEERKGGITGYKVAYPWLDITQGYGAEPAHKKGEVLAVADLRPPEGVKRENYLAELVNNGNLVPQYEHPEDAKRAEAAAMTMTPAEHRAFVIAEAQAEGKPTTADGPPEGASEGAKAGTKKAES